MRKSILFFLILQFVIKPAFAQEHYGQIDSSLMPALSPHYQKELTFDKPTHPAAWNSQQGPHVGFGSTDEPYFRTEVPTVKETDAWDGCGWRGQRLNIEIVVWSADTLEQVRFKLSDLKTAKGASISKDNITVNMVRYVLGNYPYGSKEGNCGESPYKNGYLLPDRFEPFDRFDVPGMTVRPVWVSIDIPAGAQPGHYKGNIEILAKGFKKSLPVNLEVQPPLLPPPHEWKYRLDLWQNPWVVAWDNHLQPWSAEHKSLLKKHLKLYAGAGGKYITTYAVNSPWGDNSYAIEGGMIESFKQKDGTWKFDYKIFDEYVELAMSVGIDKAITVYTPVPGEYRFRYIDAATGNYVIEHWPPGSDKFKAYWGPFLDDLRAHLTKKGWLNKTYIGINENPLDETLAAITFIRSNWRGWKITYAGDWHPELKDLLDDYSYVKEKESPMAVVAQRKVKGFTTTFYVCCQPAKPNTFLFSPPIEGRWLSWYAAAYGYSGFLRWAYDAWTQDPDRDARHGSWPAGDCYLVYPGANSCIRFEKLREGIVDFEKIRILREKLASSTDKKCRDLLRQLDEQLKPLTIEHTFNEDTLKSQVYEGERLIRELSAFLNKIGK
ncbi:DUF4091 domain-containing protein [Puia sp.]|jgi:hypothetical protein|uniref:DUF4091 domain-containing protein n=1 Tax=Puia sp. TaxID=2045100 RepID=UPI002F421806